MGIGRTNALKTADDLYLEGIRLWKEGKYEQALEKHLECLEIRKKKLKSDDLKLADVYREIGVTYHKMRKYAQALEYKTKCLNIRKRKLEPDSLKMADIYKLVGVTYRKLNRYAKALEYYLKSLEIRQKKMEPDNLKLADIYREIGVTYHEMKKYQDALENEFKCLSIRRKRLEPCDLKLADIYRDIGITYRRMKRYTQALEYKKKCLDIRMRRMEPDNPKLGDIHRSIGITYQEMGKYEEAIEHYFKCLEIREKRLKPDDLSLADLYKEIGNSYHGLGKYESALEYKLKCLKIREKKLDHHSSGLADIYRSVGATYHEMGQYKEALEYKMKGLYIRLKRHGKENLEIANIYKSIGRTYRKMGDYQESLEYYFKCLKIRKKKSRPDSLELADVYKLIGINYFQMEQYPDALKYYTLCLEIREKRLEPDHLKLADIYRSIGVTYLRMEKYDEALEIETKCLEIRKKRLGPDSLVVADIYRGLGITYHEMGNQEKALECYFRCLEIQRKKLEPDDLEIADVCMEIGASYLDLEDYSNSLEYYIRCLDIRRVKLGSKDQRVADVYEVITSVYRKIPKDPKFFAAYAKYWETLVQKPDMNEEELSEVSEMVVQILERTEDPMDLIISHLSCDGSKVSKRHPIYLFLLERENALSKLQEEISRVKSESEDLRQKVSNSSEELRGAKAEIERKDKELKELGEKLVAAEKENSDLYRKLIERDKEISRLRKELDSGGVKEAADLGGESKSLTLLRTHYYYFQFLDTMEKLEEFLRYLGFGKAESGVEEGNSALANLLLYKRHRDSDQPMGGGFVSSRERVSVQMVYDLTCLFKVLKGHQQTRGIFEYKGDEDFKVSIDMEKLYEVVWNFSDNFGILHYSSDGPNCSESLSQSYTFLVSLFEYFGTGNFSLDYLVRSILFHERFFLKHLGDARSRLEEFFGDPSKDISNVTYATLEPCSLITTVSEYLSSIGENASFYAKISFVILRIAVQFLGDIRRELSQESMREHFNEIYTTISDIHWDSLRTCTLNGSRDWEDSDKSAKTEAEKLLDSLRDLYRESVSIQEKILDTHSLLTSMKLQKDAARLVPKLQKALMSLLRSEISAGISVEEFVIPKLGEIFQEIGISDSGEEDIPSILDLVFGISIESVVSKLTEVTSSLAARLRTARIIGFRNSKMDEDVVFHESGASRPRIAAVDNGFLHILVQLPSEDEISLSQIRFKMVHLFSFNAFHFNYPETPNSDSVALEKMPTHNVFKIEFSSLKYSGEFALVLDYGSFQDGEDYERFFTRNIFNDVPAVSLDDL